jgi:excisionase family DNA binding protein
VIKRTQHNTVEFIGGLKMSEKVLKPVSYAARRLNITEARTYQLIREGLLRGAVRLGRQVRIDPDELEEFIKSGGQALPGGWKKEMNA